MFAVTRRRERLQRCRLGGFPVDQSQVFCVPNCDRFSKVDWTVLKSIKIRTRSGAIDMHVVLPVDWQLFCKSGKPGYIGNIGPEGLNASEAWRLWDATLPAETNSVIFSSNS